MKNVDRQWTTKSAARSRNDKRMRPPLGQTILGWGQGREWGQQRAGRAAMAAVVAAKIRKARKEEEEAKHHTLEIYQVACTAHWWNPNKLPLTVTIISS